MNVLSVCSGIEAATVAWERYGWKFVAYSEIDPFASAVLAHHYPNTPNLGDMKKYESWRIAEPIDILMGGTPCQSFSVAGGRAGLTDPRGQLMYSYVGIAKHFKPATCIWENVPGVLSSSGGRDFGTFIGEMEQLGYGWAYRVIDAQWCRSGGFPRAVPQRRRRVFAVFCLGNQRRASEILFKCESLQWDSLTRRKKGKDLAEDVEGSSTVQDICPTITSKWAKQSGGPSGSETGNLVMRNENETVGPLCAADHKMISNQYVGDGKVIIQAYSIREDATNNTFSATPTDVGLTVSSLVPSTQSHHAQIFLAATPYTKERRAKSSEDNETWVEGVVAPTQNAFDIGDKRATTAVLFENHAQDSRVTGPHDVASSVVAKYGTGGGNVPLVAYSLDALSSNSMKSSNPDSGCNVVDVATCIDTSTPCPSKNQGGIAVAFQSSELRTMGTLTSLDVSPCLKAETKYGDTEVRLHQPGMTVRRLTPIECERLMGFPDNYTQIPYRRKPASECPDGPRYKCLGNSMAVNCLQWLAERIIQWDKDNVE